MGRNECRCTVPLAEFGPTWASNADRDAWAKLNGVTIIEDYLGRPAVSIDDAYKLSDKRKAAQAEAERQYELRVTIANADKERQRIYDQAIAAEVKNMRGQRFGDFNSARGRALGVVREYEKTLPREVRSQLGGINVSWVEMSS